MYNIEQRARGQWHGGMNRYTRQAAIDVANRWTGENGFRCRVFDPDGNVIHETGAVDLPALIAKGLADSEYEVAHGGRVTIDPDDLRTAHAVTVELFAAIKALSDRGFFAASSCADEATNRDITRMREAFANAGGAA